jgi:pyruvate dehydrogenase phosphatase
LINDNPENNAKVRRYGSGSTALVVLQVGQDVWTANVGDCKATIGYKAPGDDQWSMKIVSGGPHNGRTNPTEKTKVENEHPEEKEVMAKDRVLGLIAVTRGESPRHFAFSTNH